MLRLSETNASQDTKNNTTHGPDVQCKFVHFALTFLGLQSFQFQRL